MTNNTIKVSAELIDALRPCTSSYSNRFRELFPVENYPDGIDITPELCVQHRGDFDLDWFATVSFVPDAYHEYRRVHEGYGDRVEEVARREREATTKRDEALTRWREENNAYSPNSDTSTEADAAYQAIRDEHRQISHELRLERNNIAPTLFAELWNDPNNYSDRVKDAVKKVVELRAQRDRQRLVEAEYALKDAEDKIRYWTEEPAKKIAYWTEEPAKKLPEYEQLRTEAQQKVAELQAVVAENQIRVARTTLEALEAQRQLAQDAVDAATAKLADAQRVFDEARSQTQANRDDAPVAS